MKTTDVENSAIALAAIMLGVMAGFFWTYTFSVNPAMREVDGQTYAIVQSLFNRHVRNNGMFLLFFFGGGVAPLVALLINYRHVRTVAFWLVALAAVIYIAGVIVFTIKVNIPLNYYVESWHPSSVPNDWAATRDAWNRANGVRVVTSLTAFLLSLAALVVRTAASFRR
ncbi:MAG: DUF1772 domain-containing protein [Gammaproteobacteria bacterium]|nr:DUF1772 domain-containing protein [Gammaproteobacteria bacterium]